VDAPSVEGLLKQMSQRSLIYASLERISARVPKFGGLNQTGRTASRMLVGLEAEAF